MRFRRLWLICVVACAMASVPGVLGEGEGRLGPTEPTKPVNKPTKSAKQTPPPPPPIPPPFYSRATTMEQAWGWDKL